MKDIETIEKIQKRATKQVKQIRHLSYSERLKRLSKQASIFIRPINKQRYNIDEQRTRAGCQKSP